MEKTFVMIKLGGVQREYVGEIISRFEKKGVKKAQIALAWLWTKKPVVAPIIGATKLSHIDDALGALEVKLSDEEIKYLEEAYIPHPIMGQIEYR